MVGALQQILTAVDERVSLKHVHRRLQAFARVLIVGTFMDDALRVTCDYPGQIHTMKAVGWGQSMGAWAPVIHTVMPSLFIATQTAGVLLILTRLAPQAGCIILTVWAAIHPFLYAQQSNLEFLLESVTIIGGILILLTSERAIKARELRLGGGLGSAGTPAEVASRAAMEKNQLLFGGRIMLSAVFVYYSISMCRERVAAVMGGPLNHENPFTAIVGGAKSHRAPTDEICRSRAQRSRAHALPPCPPTRSGLVLVALIVLTGLIIIGASYVYVYIYTHTHIYIYIFLYI